MWHLFKYVKKKKDRACENNKGARDKDVATAALMTIY